jgi:hypothetical protein
MNKIDRISAVVESLIVILFIAGIALIAAGFWQWSRPLAFVFVGLALIYISFCLSKSANPPRKDGKK